MNFESKPDTEKSKRQKKIRPPKKITESYLTNAGLYYLQRFASSEQQFKRVMTRKIDRSCRHHTETNRESCILLLDTITQKFVQAGYLNDDRYLEAMIRSLRQRGLSIRMITEKLKQKGLKEHAIKQALTEDPHPISDLQAAALFCKKKGLGAYKKQHTAQKHDKDDPKRSPIESLKDDMNKELAKFARQGFGYEIAHKIIKMTREDIEIILSDRE